MLLIVAWRRGPGAGVASAKVESLAVSLHVAGPSKALPTIRALVRAGHLMDGLDMPGEMGLLTEGFAAGRTLQVLYLGVYIPHVDQHVPSCRKNLKANATFIALLSGRLPVAVWETEAGLMIHKHFAIIEDILASFAD